MSEIALALVVLLYGAVIVAVLAEDRNEAHVEAILSLMRKRPR